MSLSDQLIERVTINLAGHEWRLVITYGALLDCEEVTGIDMLTGVEAFVNPSTRSVRALLWAVLRRQALGMTLEAAGNLIGPGEIEAVQEALTRAYVASLPPPEKPRKGKSGERSSSNKPPMGWIETRAAAKVEIRLSDSEFLDMTPLEFHAMREVYVKNMRHWELVAGMITAAVKNHSMNPPKRMVQASEFVLHRMEEDRAGVGSAHIDSRTGAISYYAE